MDGCLQKLRADHGTESTYVEHVFKFPRRNGDDSFAGETSFIYKHGVFVGFPVETVHTLLYEHHAHTERRRTIN